MLFALLRIKFKQIIRSDNALRVTFRYFKNSAIGPIFTNKI